MTTWEELNKISSSKKETVKELVKEPTFKTNRLEIKPVETEKEPVASNLDTTSPWSILNEASKSNIIKKEASSQKEVDPFLFEQLRLRNQPVKKLRQEEQKSDVGVKDVVKQLPSTAKKTLVDPIIDTTKAIGRGVGVGIDSTLRVVRASSELSALPFTAAFGIVAGDSYPIIRAAMGEGIDAAKRQMTDLSVPFSESIDTLSQRYLKWKGVGKYGENDANILDVGVITSFAIANFFGDPAFELGLGLRAINKLSNFVRYTKTGTVIKPLAKGTTILRRGRFVIEIPITPDLKITVTPRTKSIKITGYRKRFPTQSALPEGQLAPETKALIMQARESSGVEFLARFEGEDLILKPKIVNNAVQPVVKSPMVSGAESAPAFKTDRLEVSGAESVKPPEQPVVKSSLAPKPQDVKPTIKSDVSQVKQDANLINEAKTMTKQKWENMNPISKQIFLMENGIDISKNVSGGKVGATTEANAMMGVGGKYTPRAVIESPTFYDEFIAPLQKRENLPVKHETVEEFIANHSVQRIEEKGVATSFDKPQGLYTTPANVVSPHLDLGGRKKIFVIKDGMKEVTVESIGYPGYDVLKRGIDQTSTNLVWLRQEMPDVADNIRGKYMNELKTLFSKEFPKTDWNRYTEIQDLIEGYAGLKARQQGIDIIRGIDKEDPEFSEVVILNKDAILTKQQLTDIRNESNAKPEPKSTLTPRKTSEPKQEVKPVLSKRHKETIDKKIKLIEEPKNDTEEKLANFQYETLIELETAEKGERIFLTDDRGYNTGGGVVGKSSSFPKWVPEELRSRKLFNAVLPYIGTDNLPIKANEIRLYNVINAHFEEFAKKNIDENDPFQNKDVMREIDREIPEEKVSRPRPVESEGKIRKSTLGIRIKKDLVDLKILSGIIDLPEYRQANLAKMDKMIYELIASDFDKAVSIGLGLEDAPEGILNNRVWKVLKDYAKKTKDIELGMKLAKSVIIGSATRQGQEIVALRGKDPVDPIDAIIKVNKSKEQVFKEKIKKDVDSIKSKKPKIKKETWESFVESIKC